jgi:hypothetical protein
MAEHREVKAKFSIDDHSKEAFEHIKEGFEHVGEAAEHVKETVGEVFKTALGVAFGMELNASIEGIKEMGHEILGAAAGLEEQEKNIRGVLMITDKAGTSLEEMTGQAHELGEEFARMGVETGQSKSSLIGAFDEMAERTGMATEDVAALTEKMAGAGRAIPGGVEALSSGFANLASGIIRPRNEIVKLISATDVLHGNAKQVAEQLKKMAPDKAMNLGIEAISRMGDKMKNVPLSFGELTKSMGALREEVFEAVGTPMLRALGEPLNKIRDYFINNKEAIESWARSAGEKVGQWVTEGAELMKQGFEFLQDHAYEIKEDIKEGFQFAKDVFSFILDHRKEIEAMFAGLAGLKIASMLPSGASVASLFKGAGAIAGGGGGAAMAVTAAAVAAWALAADQAVKLWHETEGLKTDAQQNWSAMERAMAADHADTAEVAAKAHKQIDDLTAGTAQFGEEAERTAKRLHAMIDFEKGQIEAEKEAAKDISERHTDEMMENLGHGMLIAMDTHSLGTKAKEKSDIKVPQNLNFTGPITLHQDFKDTNPDRIVVMFKQGLARSAMARVQASTQAQGTAF